MTPLAEKGLLATLGMTLTLLALACSQTAERPSPRTGLYASMGFGHAYGVARANQASESLTTSGHGLEVRGAAGHSIVEGLAGAVEGRMLWHNGQRDDDPFGPRLSVLGGLLDWHPDSTYPGHVQLGLGTMSASILQVVAGAGDASGIGPSFPSTRGVFGHAGAGWAWRSVDGFAVTPIVGVYRARGTNGPASLDLWGTTLDVMVTWF